MIFLYRPESLLFLIIKPSMLVSCFSSLQSILPVQQPQHKEQDAPISGPRCVALFDYEGEEEDELTFSQGDIISLLELMGTEWGRGQIHGKTGIFPLNFTDVTEPLPQPVTSAVQTRTTDSGELQISASFFLKTDL